MSDAERITKKPVDEVERRLLNWLGEIRATREAAEADIEDWRRRIAAKVNHLDEMTAVTNSIERTLALMRRARPVLLVGGGEPQ